jgi:hypothetical protein
VSDETQPSLNFESPLRQTRQTRPRRPRTEQQDNLDRVKLSIGSIVEEFCRGRLASGAVEFRISELTTYVLGRSLRAPASPDRILRQLRLEGVVSYEVTNRAQSLYRITGVRQ